MPCMLMVDFFGTKWALRELRLVRPLHLKRSTESMSSVRHEPLLSHPQRGKVKTRRTSVSSTARRRAQAVPPRSCTPSQRA